MGPHLLESRVHEGSFRQVVAGHPSITRFAVAAAIAQAVDLLEAHGVCVILWSDNKISTRSQSLDRAFNLAGFVDRVLEVGCHCR